MLVPAQVLAIRLHLKEEALQLVSLILGFGEGSAKRDEQTVLDFVLEVEFHFSHRQARRNSTLNLHEGSQRSENEVKDIHGLFGVFKWIQLIILSSFIFPLYFIIRLFVTYFIPRFLIVCDQE